MSRLVIIGAGGHGKVVADAAEAAGGWTELVFLDGSWPAKTAVEHWPVIGKDTDLEVVAVNQEPVIVAVGDAARRLSLCGRVREAGLQLVSVVHPASVISAYARIGEGVVIMAGGLVNPGARVGDATIINTGAIVEHDCDLGRGVHVCPGARMAGGVTIGDRSWIGIGSTIRQGICIGSDVTVGAGSVVVTDLPDGVTAFGVPARVRGVRGK